MSVDIDDKTEEKWLECKTCNISCHKNDYPKHIAGRSHKAKEKSQMEPSNLELQSKDNPAYECKLCGTKLSNMTFYKIHIGSKIHKRKVRKCKSLNNIANLNGDTATDTKVGRSMNGPLLGSNVPERPTFVRKKYKTRNITTDDEYYNQLRNYVDDMVAYLSVKLALDANVQEFQISVNDKTWKSFGDIVLTIIYKDKKTTYAIKCKQVSSIDKQIQNLNEAKIILEKEYRSISSLKVIHDQVKFGIFIPCTLTNVAPVTVSKDVLNRFSIHPIKDIIGKETKDIAVVALTKKNDLINTTGDCENIFTFFMEDNKDYILPNVYVYTKQIVYPWNVGHLISQKIDTKGNFQNEFSKYIRNWSNGNLGGFYKLTKHDVVLKIGEILLKPYISSPKMINLKYDSFSIWNEVMSRVELTVMSWEPFIISKVCQPINRFIEDALGVKIDVASRTVNIKHRIDSFTDVALKAYLFEEIDNVEDDVPLKLIYKAFWKAEQIPLLLAIEDDEDNLNYILEVICLMKYYGVHKKFLIKTKYPDKLKPKFNIVMFRRLEDIKDFINLNELSIRITDNYKLTLATIASSDHFVLKWISPNIFFDLALGNYSLKQNMCPKYDFEIESKIVLSRETMDEVRKHLYGQSELIVVDRLYGVDPKLF